ncbi:LuxR C-terminal-related transcriptional regulator [Streptomyces sp. NPDC056390]|uniref:LuxR C-terminal-related transcriptional regulator n=1 Tax=Streptomyces sp. NPDC056390 TaxID=3345806 RepID=UPI0035D67CD6
MYVSRRTVEAHLTKIYAKLGVSSRTHSSWPVTCCSATDGALPRPPSGRNRAVVRGRPRRWLRLPDELRDVLGGGQQQRCQLAHAIRGNRSLISDAGHAHADARDSAGVRP